MSSYHSTRNPLPGARPRDPKADLEDRFRALEQDLFDRLLTRLRAEIDDRVAAKVADHTRALTRKAENSSAVVPINNKQLAVLSREISAQVRDDVLGEVNRTLVPQINKMAGWLTFQTADTDGMVDAYRRGVERQSNADTLLLTDAKGAKDKRIISAHVRTFFGEDDSD